MPCASRSSTRRGSRPRMTIRSRPRSRGAGTTWISSPRRRRSSPPPEPDGYRRDGGLPAALEPSAPVAGSRRLARARVRAERPACVRLLEERAPGRRPRGVARDRGLRRALAAQGGADEADDPDRARRLSPPKLEPARLGDGDGVRRPRRRPLGPRGRAARGGRGRAREARRAFRTPCSTRRPAVEPGEPEGRTLLFFGLIRGYKGLDVLIRALPAVARGRSRRAAGRRRASVRAGRAAAGARAPSSASPDAVEWRLGLRAGGRRAGALRGGHGGRLPVPGARLLGRARDRARPRTARGRHRRRLARLDRARVRRGAGRARPRIPPRWPPPAWSCSPPPTRSPPPPAARAGRVRR